MNNNQQKEVSPRDVRNLVDYMENEYYDVGNHFSFTIYPEIASVDFDVEIIDAYAWAEHLIENGSPDFTTLLKLEHAGVVEITYDDIHWEGCDEDNIADQLGELYEWNEDGTISTPFII